MTAYCIQVEGVFVIIPGIDEHCGFFTTVYIHASGREQIMQQISRVIRHRLQRDNIQAISDGYCSSYFSVAHISEITDPELAFDDETGSGFSFFTMGSMDVLRLILRRLYLKHFKAWKIIPREAILTNDSSQTAHER